MKKVVYLTTILALVSLGIIPKSWASEPFETQYDINYEVRTDGETRVTQYVKIINKEDDILATTYTHTLKHMKIYDVKGNDKKGQLEIEVKTEEDSTTIKANLKNQVIGKGKANEITLTYKTQDIASKVGEVWNINLPQLAPLDDVEIYNISILVPKEFGPKIFLSPNPNEEIQEISRTIYKFDKENVSTKGVTAAFGKYQLLNYKLKYHLKNENRIPTVQEIALPPDITNIQQISFEQLNPPPKNVSMDTDGNILAQYTVPAKAELNIELIGSAKILGRQVQPEFGGKMHEIPRDLVNKYTQNQPFWEVDASQIQKLATELFDPKKTVTQNAENIYNYITENLVYDFNIVKQDTIERKGALTALTKEGTWACMEFTDIFIAISRAMGIPARELNGYAFTQAENIVPLSIDLKSGDLLHAWPEFYDPNFGWVVIDPTWGTTSGIDYFTKLDTNHFAFVIKGLNSEYPFPAGAYRVSDEEKQVEVDFAQEQVNFTENLILTRATTLNPIKMLKGYKKYKLQHKGGVVLYNINNTKENLLPFETKDIYLPKNDTTIRFSDFSGEEKIRQLNITSDKSINPFTLLLYSLVVLGLCTILFLLINRLRNRRKLRSLRDLRLPGQDR